MVCYETEWRETVVSPPNSEPPPPYSPPRSKSKLISSSKISMDSPYRHGHQNTPREILKKALNHGPSSAFSPPTPRHSKNENVITSLPPPYSSVPSYPGLQKQSPSRTTKDVIIPRNQIPPKNWLPNHPTGPVLRIGKSLDIPKKGSVNAHSHITAHKHPGKKEFYDPSSQSTPTNSRLAYVGIASTKEHLNNQMLNNQISYSKSRTTSKAHDGVNGYHPPPTGRSRRDKPSKRNYRVDLNAAESMLNARAQPAHVAYPTAKCQYPQTPSNTNVLGSNYNYYCNDGGSEKKTRLRSYRSLDELSDLLEEEASHIRFGSRSLDDLTEPLYENISFFKSQRAHNPIYGLESYLDGDGNIARCPLASSNFDSPPQLPPKKNSKTYALDTGHEEGEEVDIGIQLQKLKEIARVLGVKFQRGELSSTSSVGRSVSSSSTSSEKTRLRKAFALIDNTLQATLPKSPPMMHRPPGVPARAPVIHDVSFLLNKEEQGIIDRENLPYLPEGPLSDKRGMSVASCSPETDCISQESGYSSVDSRSYCSSTNRSHKKGDRNEIFQKEGGVHCGFSPKTFLESSPLRQQEAQNEDLSRRIESRTPDYFSKNVCPSYNNSGPSSEEPQSLPCLSSSTPVCSPSAQKREIPQKNKKSPVSNNCGTLHPDRVPRSPQGILKNPYKTRQTAPVRDSKGENQSQLGIYIKSVVPGGAADQDGRLQAGDQLLSVDGKSLVGISQEEAAQYMVGTGPVVTLEVARQGALYHGLAPLLSQPSPQVATVEIRRPSMSSRQKDRIIANTIPEVYNERLVDWNQPPKSPPVGSPGQKQQQQQQQLSLSQRPPLPPPSNTVPRPTKSVPSTPTTLTSPLGRSSPSAFSPPRKTSPSLMVTSKSSPNLAVETKSGTPSKNVVGRQTPPLYSVTNRKDTNINPLNSSMPCIRTSDSTPSHGPTPTTSKDNFEFSVVPPLHPKPLSSVIPIEKVQTGIRHRDIEETKLNPDLPKYTFVPSDPTSPGGSVCRWRWEERHRCSGHGAGCMPSCNNRRGSGPPSNTLSGDSGIDMTCQACDLKLWRSMSNICDYEYISSPTSSSLSQSCVSIPPALPPKGVRPSKVLGPHFSCPLIHARTQENFTNEERDEYRPLTPSNRNHARSSPNIHQLFLHSPPDSSSRSSSSPPLHHLHLNSSNPSIPVHTGN